MRDRETDARMRIVRGLIVLLLISGGGAVARAQQPPLHIKTGELQVPEIVVARGHREAARTRRESLTTNRPAPLNPQVKQSLLKAANVHAVGDILGSSFFLTPATPSLDGKGFLRFANAISLDCGPSGAAYIGAGGWVPEHESAVSLLLQATAGKAYMIDFAVGHGGTYDVLIGNAEQTFTGTNHLVVVYQASKTGTEWIPLMMYKGDYWIFYYCEVTPLN